MNANETPSRDAETAGATKVSASDVRSDVSNKARDYLSYADQLIRARPVLSIGLAAAIGFVIGAWIVGGAFDRED